MKFQIENQHSGDVKYTNGVRHNKEVGIVCVNPNSFYIKTIAKKDNMTEDEAIAIMYAKWLPSKIERKEVGKTNPQLHYDLTTEVEVAHVDTVEDLVEFIMEQEAVYFNYSPCGTLLMVITYSE